MKMLWKIKKKKNYTWVKSQSNYHSLYKLFADDQLTVKSNEGKLSDTRFRDTKNPGVLKFLVQKWYVTLNVFNNIFQFNLFSIRPKSSSKELVNLK